MSGIRWLVAGLVTAAVFAATLLVSAALVLPLWIKSDADRWVVAGSVGVAMAALAALWGAGFARREKNGGSAQAAQAAQPADPSATGISMRADASEHGRVYQAGHDQTINEK